MTETRGHYRAAGPRRQRQRAPRRTEAEADFQTFVMHTAQLLDWVVFHDYDPRMDQAGLPDLVLWHERAGRFVLMELKAADGHLSPAQQTCLAAAERAGVETYVFFPQERARVLAVLDWQQLGVRLS